MRARTSKNDKLRPMVEIEIDKSDLIEDELSDLSSFLTMSSTIEGENGMVFF